MLYGHVESLADRVDHLRQLRALQDETRGFVGFVPLPYQPENNEIPVRTPPTGFDGLRTIAVSRIYLDNFDHITAYWVGMGLKLEIVKATLTKVDNGGRSVEFEAKGAPRVVLSTAEGNKAAQRLFARAGFRRTMIEMTRDANAQQRKVP